MEFESKDITIISHGKIEPVTSQAIKLLRQLFPKSRIILSTWKDSDTKGIEYDTLIENEDPGAKVFNVPENAVKNNDGSVSFSIKGREYRNYPKPNNVNRIIKTLQSALDAADTKYTLRLRTDIVLRSKNFLKYWDKFPKYNGRYKIFEHRIINDSSFAQFAHVMKDGIQLLPFHMSDWIHFGLTNDIKLLYSCPLQDLENSAQYWYKRERKQYEPFLDAGWQYPPETYVLYSLVKHKFPDVAFKDSDDYNRENMSVSNRVMADNFIFVDQDDFKFEIEKYPNLKMWSSEIYDGFITHREWQNLYKTYCDKSYNFSDIDFSRIGYYKELLNIGYFLKYPGKYIRTIKNFSYIFNKKSLREKFYIGVSNND